MKACRFRIRNYKSIIDSGDCHLADRVTVLAGKNESGKTALLEALRDFDVGIDSLPEDAIPLNKGGSPEVEIGFTLEETEVIEWASQIGPDLDPDLQIYMTRFGLVIVKTKDGSYRWDDELEKQIELAEKRSRKNVVKAISKSLTLLHPLIPVEGDRPSVSVDIPNEEVRSALGNYVEKGATLAKTMPQGPKRDEAMRLIGELSNELKGLGAPSLSRRLFEAVAIPTFIHFSDFSDLLPFEVPIAEAEKHQTVCDFAQVAGLDLKVLRGIKNGQSRHNLLSERSAKITGDFKNHWGQDELTLTAMADGDRLRLGVVEAGDTILYRPEQRSKGFQWFLAFYLRLNACRRESNIILVDEPGLYLHARAQQDVLAVLERISEDGPVIISTHSPYLIAPDKLDRVRLVVKDNKTGTRVENKIHKSADKETLAPIITAIGLDLTRGFTAAKDRNVVFEGISDYYYATAMNELLPAKHKLEAALVPCTGASKSPLLASLLLAWELQFVVVLDNDPEGKRVAQVLGKLLCLNDNRIVFTSPKSGKCMEDLFDVADFNTLVLVDVKREDSSSSNSQFLKTNRHDKVLLAKRFLERIRSAKTKPILSDATMRSFANLFDRINTGLQHTNT